MSNQFFRWGSLAGAIALAVTSVTILLMLCATPAAAQPAPVEASYASNLEYAPGRLLVRFRPGVQVISGGDTSVTSGLAGLDSLFAAQQIQSAESLFGRNSALAQIYLLELPAESDIQAAATAFAKNASVEWAEPDYLAHAATAPNDPHYSGQWALDKISAPSAWDVTTGTLSVVIAVLDTGTDVDHPDLNDRLWMNPGETPANGLDDDGNGKVDDVYGWNFIAQTNEVADDDGHGTKVAGAAAAEANNGAGIAGVCWNCRVMAVKVMQAGGVANYSDVALGLYYAADKRAKVINVSLGGTANSNTLRAAVEYAAENAVIVAAAGDGNASAPFYPAAYPGVLAVGGTTIGDERASFSNYGDWVDAAAPAVNITTTLNGGGYGAASGTSLSVPLVSGLTGLIWTLHPEWTPAMVQAQVINTTDFIPAVGLGSGRINAAHAVSAAPAPLLGVASSKVNNDPYGRPVPGATATLAVTIANDWLEANNLTGTLSTADPFVTVLNAEASFGSLASGEIAAGSPVYSFTVASGAGYNHPIPFTLYLSADDGAYTTTLPITITTVSANQNFCGTITSNQTWTNDKTYIITCNVGVAPGKTLTIQPGTVIKFNGNYSLNVGGTLVAIGTQAQPIRFMSNTAGMWGRIYFDDTSVDATTDVTGTYQGGNSLQWTVIEKASQGIGCNYATPYLSHVTTDGGGLSCAIGNPELWLQDSNIGGDTSFSFNHLLGTYDTTGYVYGVSVVGTYAYIADGESGLRILDISNPAAIIEVGFYDTPGNAEKAIISGGLAYVSDGYSGFRIVDVSDPVNPIEVGSYDTPDYAYSLVVSSNFAYVADRGAGLRVVDISDPTDPVEIGYFDTAGWAYDIAIVDSYVYLADGNSGLRVIDISNPASPVGIGSYYEQGSAQSLVVSGSYVYIANDTTGLQIVDISDPTQPTDVGSYDTPTHALGVSISGNYAYVADENTGLRVVDISDPNHLSEVDSYPVPPGCSCARDVTVSGKYAYVAYGYSGLRIFPVWGENKVHFLRNAVPSGDVSLPEQSEIIGSTIAGIVTAGNASTIQDTIANDGFTIDGSGVVSRCSGGTVSMESGSISESNVTGINISGISTVQENHVLGGSLTVGGSSVVVSNTVTQNGIFAGADSILRGNSVEDAPTWAITALGNSIFFRNRVVGGTIGIYAGDGDIRENLVANTTSVGIYVYGSGNVVSNTLTHNSGNTLVAAYGTPIFHGNNLEFNTGDYDFWNDTGSAIDASGNWWGTTDSGVIDERIYDFSDDYLKGQVIYNPVLTGPVQTAPAYVRSVKLTPESPVGIETVKFDVDFSRKMQRGILVDMLFYTQRIYDSTNSGLPSNETMDIAIDPDGLSWFGTYGGAAHFDGKNWTVFNVSNSGLPNNYVYKIARDIDGSHWFGTSGGGVANYDGLDWTVFNTGNSDLPSNIIMDIAVDKDGSLWFATGNGGVAHYTGGDWEVYNTGNSGLPSNHVRVVVIDNNGSLWFGTDNGVAHFNGTSWTLYNSFNSGLPDNVIRSILQDSDGSYWFATDIGGVAHFDGLNWTVLNSSNSGLPSNTVMDITKDVDGTYWFATYAGGVVHFDGSVWEIYNTTNSTLPNDIVYAIAIDPSGSLWMGTWEGVGMFFDGPENKINADPIWSSTDTHYTASYNFDVFVPRGMYTITVGNFIGADGIEIAPNTAYTFTVDYIGNPETSTPPAPTVRACASPFTTTLSASWTIPPTAAIGLYRYAIGTAPGFSDVTNWITTTLTTVNRDNLNLLPGEAYYFSAQARNNGGIWSEIGSSNEVIAGAGGCPQVDFNAAPASGMSPLSVNFTAQITGTVTSQLWRFGDGSESAQLSPTHVYWTPEVYTVTLDVYGPGGWTTITKPESISVTPDTVPPTGTMLINGNAVYVTATQTTLSLAASDLSGLDGMRFSDNGNSWTNWEPYGPTKSWALSPGDGTKTVYVQVRDTPGNTVVFSDIIILDTDTPSSSAMPSGTAGNHGWWRSPVYVTLSATDSGSGVAYSQFNLDMGAWLTYTTPITVAGEGIHTLAYYSTDFVGFREVTHTLNIQIDTLAPIVSASITGTLGDGGWFISAPQVTLAAADPTSGIDQIQYRLDGGSWQTYLGQFSIPVSGVHILEYRAADMAGNQSILQSATVYVDITPPTTTAVPSGTAGDNGWWRSTVTVSLSAFDAASGVEATYYHLEGGNWLPYTFPITLTNDGIHAVGYSSIDVAGNPEISRTLEVKIDTLPPTTALDLTGMQISGWYVSDVQITLSALDNTSGVGVVRYRLDGAAWQTYLGTVTLSNDGIHSLEYYASDAAGNIESIQVQEIRRDITPPTAAVAALTPYQSTITFTVSWAGNDALSGMGSFDVQYRDNGGVWTDWLTATTAISGTFVGLDGHTFDWRIRARDVLGNMGEYTLAEGASTHVDTARPIGGIAINGGALTATDRNVQLVLLANGAAQAAFSTDGISFTPWEPFPSTSEVRPFQLPAGDGSKTVWVRYLDFYGQVVAYSDTITLDTSLPGDVGVSINDDSPLTNEITVTLTLKAPPETQDMLISNSSRFVAAQWQPYDGTQPWVLAYYPGVDVYQVYVKFRSVNGVVSERYDDIITLDLIDPPPPVDNEPPSGSVVINAGADETDNQIVLLDVLAADNPGGVGVTWVYFREWKFDPVAVQWVTVRSSGWLPYDDTTTWTLSSGTGVKYIGAWFADSANNVSNPVVLDSINLVLPGDTLGQGDVTQYRQTFTPGETVTITLNVTSGDADLYIWRPGGTGAPDYWSNLPGTATEQLVFTALEGEYLIEVHGYASASFTLDIAASGGGGLRRANSKQPGFVEALLDVATSEKPLPPHPLVATRPGEAQPPGEQPVRKIYLPLVKK